jgi:hypothetical protein
MKGAASMQESRSPNLEIVSRLQDGARRQQAVVDPSHEGADRARQRASREASAARRTGRRGERSGAPWCVVVSRRS